ncbi:MAG: hypothetical protein PHI85_09115 [Victivallaceae bacterium]|nr:hypothetical protein [Victivallaceae bacterium]
MSDTVYNVPAGDGGTGAAIAAHTHLIAEVVGLLEALAGKSDTGHTHAATDVSGLAASLARLEELATGANAYAADALARINEALPEGHVHTMEQVTGLFAALSGKAAGVHTHAEADVTGLAAALETLTTAAAAAQTKADAAHALASAAPSIAAGANISCTAADGVVTISASDGVTAYPDQTFLATPAEGGWICTIAKTGGNRVNRVKAVVQQTGPLALAAAGLAPGDIALFEVTNPLQKAITVTAGGKSFAVAAAKPAMYFALLQLPALTSPVLLGAWNADGSVYDDSSARDGRKFNILTGSLDNGVFSKTWAELGTAGIVPVQLYDRLGVYKNDDPLITITITTSGVSIDFSTSAPTGIWWLVY